jgi:hypothetical protein
MKKPTNCGFSQFLYVDVETHRPLSTRMALLWRWLPLLMSTGAGRVWTLNYYCWTDNHMHRTPSFSPHKSVVRFRAVHKCKQLTRRECKTPHGLRVVFFWYVKTTTGAGTVQVRCVWALAPFDGWRTSAARGFSVAAAAQMRNSHLRSLQRRLGVVYDTALSYSLMKLDKAVPENSVAWFGLVWFGLVWFGLVWFGLVWFGLVWFGLVWLGVRGPPNASGYEKPSRNEMELVYGPRVLAV